MCCPSHGSTILGCGSRLCSSAPALRWMGVDFRIEALMAKLICSLLACLFLGFGSQALADREVHVVVVGQGYQTDDFYALPEARVLVDRPGQDVGLVLLDGGQVHWKIEATAGTIIDEIVRSGPRTETSKISFSGIPMVGLQDPALPLVYHPLGRDFRAMVNVLSDWFGSDRLHSFQGRHIATASAVSVDHVDTTTVELAQDYLSSQLSSSADLPPMISNWDRDLDGDVLFGVEFNENGVQLTGPHGHAALCGII